VSEKSSVLIGCSISCKEDLLQTERTRFLLHLLTHPLDSFVRADGMAIAHLLVNVVFVGHL